MDLFYYVLFWVCVLGLCLGSFSNVVILRTLKNESIVFPASKCPKCNHKLYFWHNIPVLSYIVLGGKCYFCKEKISIQYPIIEILTMLLFALTFLKFGFNILTLFALFWVSCLIIMTGTDVKEKLVDCNIAVVMAISGFIYNFIAYGKEGALWSVLGIVIGAVIMELIANAGYIFAGSRAMGEADTYVAAALGAIFAKSVVEVFVYAFVASMLFILPVFLYNQYKADNKKTCILFILFTLSSLIFKTLCQNYLTLVAIVVIGLMLAMSILGQLKSEEKHNYLPFVPALSAGALYFLFFCI